MKTILLAGASNSLPAEDAATVPKAMLEIGGRPIVTRVMEIYSHFGHTDFIIASGHQSVLLKQFFANYHLMANDIRVSLDTGKIKLRPNHGAGWRSRSSTPAPIPRIAGASGCCATGSAKTRSWSAMRMGWAMSISARFWISIAAMASLPA